MTTFAARMAKTALRLLTTYGSVMVCGRPVIASYDTTTSSTVSGGGDISYTGYGNATPYTIQEIAGGTTIMQGDLKMLFSSTTRPQINDYVYVNDGIGDGYYRVMSVDISNINNTDVAYILQLRQ